MKPKTLTLVLDVARGERAYLDGIDTGIPRDETLYAGDIVAAAGGHPVVIEQIDGDLAFGCDWPKLLSEIQAPDLTGQRWVKQSEEKA